MSGTGKVPIPREVVMRERYHQLPEEVRRRIEEDALYFSQELNRKGITLDTGFVVTPAFVRNELAQRPGEFCDLEGLMQNDEQIAIRLIGDILGSSYQKGRISWNILAENEEGQKRWGERRLYDQPFEGPDRRIG